MKICPKCKGEGYTRVWGLAGLPHCPKCDAVGYLNVPTGPTTIRPGPGRVAVYAARYRAGKRIFDPLDAPLALS